MAYDGSWTGVFSGRSNFRIYLYVRRDQTDAANNRSSYAWQLLAQKTGTQYSTWASDPYPWAVSVAGQGWSGSSSALDFRNTNQNIVGSGVTGWVPHDSAGNLNITVAAWYHTGGAELFGNADIPATWWATDRITPPATVPPAPTPVGMYAITATSMEHSWDSAGDGGSPITTWQWQYSTSATFTSGNSTVFNTGTGENTATGLTPRTRYYFRARGVNAIGTGPWCAIISGTTVDVPDKPTLAVTATSTTQLNVKMTNPAYLGGGITDNEQQLSLSPTFSTIKAQTNLAASVFTALVRGTTYYVRGRVKSSTGWGPYSTTLTATTLIQVPSAPTGSGITDLASTTAYTTLGAVADTGGAPLNNLRVEYVTPENALGITTITVGALRGAFLQDLEPGARYSFRTAVANSGAGGGWSAYGAWVAFTTKGNVPSPPRALTVSNLTGSSAVLLWQPPAELYGSLLLSYALRVSRDAGFATSLQSFLIPAEDLSRAVSLSPGVTYYAQVWSNSSNGLGSYSDVLSFTTPGTAATATKTWQRVAGTWRSGTVWQRVAGTWRSGTVWQRINGTWRKG